ncbi:hypothetical protein CCY99_08220 [Helicobacter sp. 16-1353]|uniref:DUF2972 domain-containing protein n=1 Tax=Helicobacter sp. 16-1353 TaxID=2004996 RepID=UPI000DCB187D|nr:DUF2972 domain-containing protein [Helicobacter sp. 16-1353]RAX51927.1 hypothetical protein CCY99_08220 [Helicobacter sp. 16-1353]
MGGGNLIFSSNQQIFLKTEKYVDVSRYFFDNILLYDLAVFVDNEKSICHMDKDLFMIIKSHLNNYYIEILTIIESLNKNLITENNIIDFINKDANLRKQYMAVFDYEIEIIKQNAPHIVESWEFYNKFKENKQ